MTHVCETSEEADEMKQRINELDCMSDNKAETGLIGSVKNYNLILMTSVETLLK